MSLTPGKVLETVNQSLDDGQLEQAKTLLTLAVQRWGQTVEILSLEIKMHLLAREIEEALEAVNTLSDLQSDHPLVLLQQGALEVQLGLFELAIPHLEEAIAAYPGHLTLYKWLGHAFHEIGDLEAAISAYEMTLTDSQLIKETRLPLAFAYRNSKMLFRSDALLMEELQNSPDNLVARFALSQNRLMQGDLENGFLDYESRWQQRLEDKVKLPCPLWQFGDHIRGKDILIFDEQGFGDCIQFSRFIPEVKSLAKSVALRLRPKLQKLLSSQISDCQIYDDLSHASSAEIAIPMMSLPLVLGLNKESIKVQYSHQYLNVDASDKINWATYLAGKTLEKFTARKKIGLVWQGDPNSPAEQGRSMSFRDVLPLFNTDKAVFYILQMEDGRDRFEGMTLPDNVIDLGNELDKDGHAFTDTAAVMMLMDVVLTSDTATAHLAGALGCDSWIMLKYVPEWRWELEGAESYWYQSVKLYRQESRGDWQSVVEQISAEIMKL
ncbi:tetratricopeptide repeat protein [Curvivirga aplysinae]|uniref:tetratricopeptide repeat protein n=1 Tax=Curvivirga aplysinae TaxID=2529852 RepID=UPI0012BD1D32|nr:tetratricopeptide repeat protein [Curvivirga aplysinae]MTI10159.1 tetratricopeptide repeat protein [Curvivirga aplysinae]